MKYYSVRVSYHKKDIGYYPQTKGGSFGVLSVPSEIRSQIRFDRKIPELVKLLPLIIDHRAQITDVLGSYELGIGMIVNERTKKVLENFKLPPLLEYYDIEVLYKKELIEGYNLFQYYVNLYDWIDLDNSKAELTTLSGEVLSEIAIETEDKFKVLKQSLLYQHEKQYQTTRTVLKKEFDYDIFIDNISNIGTVISERLYNAMIEANITGLTYEEYPILIRNEK